MTAYSTNELYEPLTNWFHSIEALNALACVIVLANKTGNFQCRLGLQTATTLLSETNNPVNPSSASTQIASAPTRSFIRFNPNGSTDGDIDTAAYFRVGIFYSLSAGSTPAQGDIRVEGLTWR